MEPFYKNEYRNQLEDLYIESAGADIDNEKALELLLLYTLPIHEAGPTAQRLISHFGSFSKVMNADFEQLIEVGGMDWDSAVLVSLVKNLSGRMKAEPDADTASLDGLDSSIQYFSQLLHFKKSPLLYAAVLDENAEIVKAKEIASGKKRFSDSSYNQICKLCREESASSLVIAYNVSGSDKLPGDSEREFFRRFKKLPDGKAVKLYDVIVFNEDGAYAFSGDLRLAAYLG